MDFRPRGTLVNNVTACVTKVWLNYIPFYVYVHAAVSVFIKGSFFVQSECDGRLVTDETLDINDLFECTIIKGDLQIDTLPGSWR